MTEFNNMTIVAATEVIAEFKSHGDMSVFEVQWGIVGNSSSKAARVASWAQRATSLDASQVMTENGLVHLERAIVETAIKAPPGVRGSDAWKKFVAGLRFDGFEVVQTEVPPPSGAPWQPPRTMVALARMLPADMPGLDFREAEDEVTTLLVQSGITIAKGHLERAVSAFQRGEWSSANGELSNFYESYLNEIAVHLGCDSQQDSKVKRDSLGRLQPPFLLTEYNEWNENNQKPQYVQGLMSRMHPHWGTPRTVRGRRRDVSSSSYSRYSALVFATLSPANGRRRMTTEIKSVPSISVTYAHNGNSTKANALGMRLMQERAYEKRGEQYLLIKSPPASGKSRALMFIALDKLQNQGLKQAIIVVPERSIGASFHDEPLSKFGFWADWHVEPKWNLCNAPGNDNGGKIKAVGTFLDSGDKVLVCTHATFRFAVDQYGIEKFDGRLIAVDEFHHVSSSPDNKLGLHLAQFIARDCVHVVAMTGSYFRGDAEDVLDPQDEAKFDKVTYTYYEQLNGYEYLKELDIGYFFYSGPMSTTSSTSLIQLRRRFSTFRMSIPGRVPRTRSGR